MSRPPRVAEWLTSSLAPPHHRDEILGDLAELWQVHLCRQSGRRWRYWHHALSLLWWANRDASRRASARGVDPGRRRSPRLGQDVRYAIRMARRQPAFTAITIATLALGMAAATAIFTICDRVLIQPLPYAEPDRIVVLDRVSFGFTSRGMTVARVVADSPALAAVGLYAPGGLNLGDPEAPIRLAAAAVTHGFFPAMGANASIGRTFGPEDDRDTARVAVISFDLWRRTFQEDRGIVGREIRLNSQSFAIVGVMPRGFSFPGDTAVWVPVWSDQQLTGAAFAPMVVARLAPGVTAAQAANALARAEARRRGPGTADERPTATPLKEELVGGVRPSLLLLATLVALLLAATSANIAGLLLSRLRVRQRELSLRAALGASRARLAVQMAVECAVLATAGAAAGLVLAFWILHVFQAAVPTFAPHVDLTRPGLDIFGVAAAVAVMSTFLFGLAPAAAVVRKQPADVLREGASPSRRTRWFGQSLVIAQVAVALVLLAGTSAALAALLRLSRIELGFENPRAVVFELTLPFSRYGTTASVSTLIARLESELGGIPGVAGTGVTDYAPGSTQTGIGVSLVEMYEAPEAGEPRPRPALLTATPNYFRAMGIRLIAGRAFSDRDTATAPRVAILSETAARSLAGEPANAIGRRLQDRFQPKSAGYEVVGVVADVRLRRRMTGSQTQLYLPLTQSFVRGSAGVVLDVAVDDMDAVIARARQTLRAIDPELPIYSVLRMADLRAHFLATERLTVALTTAFGALAIVLAAIGLYGLLSQFVSQQRREIGIRMALGADRGRLMRGVIARSVTYATLGSLVGGAVLFGGARLLVAFVPSFDTPRPEVLAVNVLVLILVAALAAWQPARRASRVDPLVALRGE